MISCHFDSADLAEGLKGLLGRVTIGALSESLEEGVEQVRRAAEINLVQASAGPYSTGRTAEEGVKTAIELDADGQPVVSVGMMRGKSRASAHGRAYIGYWLEHGIPSRGIAARPWFRPAVDAHSPGILSRFVAALKKRVGFA